MQISPCSQFGRRVALAAIIWLIGLSSCVQVKKTPASAAQPANEVAITLLHLNDIYEMSPLGGAGGLARVASLRDQLLAQTPHTITVLAGDLLSPSAIGLAKVNGKRIAGEQMIDCMNQLGLDYMIFGNHEFDLKEPQLRQRISESKFQWIASNIKDGEGLPFTGVVPYVIHPVSFGSQTLKIGIFGLTIDSAHRDWIRYDTNYPGAAAKMVKLLREEKKVDLVVALTHLALPDDIDIATHVGGIDLILGGHEHENMQVWRGKELTPIFKADANARTVYVHRLSYNAAAKSWLLKSELVPISNRFKDQAKTAQTVAKWEELAFKSFRKQGLEPARLVTTAKAELDGLEASIRTRSTLLTELTAKGILASFPKAQASFFNSGTIRIDDKIAKGTAITEYDVLRILPFGGDTKLIRIPGKTLQKTLDIGLANRGRGGFLQYQNISGGDGKPWLLGGQPVEANASYVVAINDFLLTGQEQGLPFFKPGSEGIEVLETGQDMRIALSGALQTAFGKP